MNSEILRKILQRFKEGKFTWADARKLIAINENKETWDEFFIQIAEIRHQYHKEEKKIKIYTPGQNFPAISVTGTHCDLNCEHCDKKYLHGMIPAPTEKDFVEKLSALKEKGSIGALLSGGSTLTGKVPVTKFVKQIKKFKEKNNFFFNAHVGLVNFAEAIALKNAGIDTVSYDLVLDGEVIKNEFHLNDEVEEYIVSYINLRKAGIRTVPHVLIGARFGKIAREIDSLKIIEDYLPDLIVFIAMIPPKTKDHKIAPGFSLLTPDQIARFFVIAKARFPNIELSLGCMRPRGKFSFELEKWSILSGANRIEIPSRKTIKWLEKQGYEIKYYGACCAVPKVFEPIAEAIDVKGTLKNRK